MNMDHNLDTKSVTLCVQIMDMDHNLDTKSVTLCVWITNTEEFKDGSLEVGVLYVGQYYENDLMTCEWRIDLLGLMEVYDTCKKSG